MGRSAAVAVLFLLACLPALASDPGQPVQWDDWVVDAPGLTAQSWMSRLAWEDCAPTSPIADIRCNYSIPSSGADPEGIFYFQRQRYEQYVCAGASTNRRVWEIWAQPRSGPPWLIAHVSERCDQIGNAYFDKVQSLSMSVDRESGHLILLWQTESGTTPPAYGTGVELMRVTGLTTLFEVLQSYQPQTSSFGFRVPSMPEGLQHADYFDTFWGNLDSVGDWSQAQPLQCGYPATAPSVGAFLTVEDTLPSPAPGRGYYYFTAVNYQGQRRYGRQANGGVLSGRDPAVLPACSRTDLESRTSGSEKSEEDASRPGWWHRDQWPGNRGIPASI